MTLHAVPPMCMPRNMGATTTTCTFGGLVALVGAFDWCDVPSIGVVCSWLVRGASEHERSLRAEYAYVWELQACLNVRTSVGCEPA